MHQHPTYHGVIGIHMYTFFAYRSKKLLVRTWEQCGCFFWLEKMT